MTAVLAFHADTISPLPLRRITDARLPNWTPAVKDPAPVYLPDAVVELACICHEEGSGDDSDRSEAALNAIQAQMERDEAVRDEMRTALLCAKNVLTLLEPEVQAMSYRANYVPSLIDNALTADEEGRATTPTNRVIEATTGLLLVLSLMRSEIAAHGPQAVAAVQAFCRAVAEAKQS